MAFTMLEFGVMNNAGFTVITGEIGSEKPLVRHLLKMLNPNITTGLISNSPQGRQELLQWIMMALRQPFEELSGTVQAVPGFSLWPVRDQPPNHPDYRRGAEFGDRSARAFKNAIEH
jgi:hypothetical protein